MKRILALLLTLTFIFSLASCTSNSNYVPSEQPVLYYKDIYVVITDIEKKQWFAGTAQREVKITVYSEEYDLTDNDTAHYTGMFGNMPFWEYEEGDTVKAQLFTWIMESTGQVTRRYINKVY